MFVISVHDPFFDTHREQCEHIYVFVLNSLSYLFTTTDEESQEGNLHATWKYMPGLIVLCLF